MNQSLLYHAFGVREGYQYVRTDYPSGAVQFTLKVKPELFVCPTCHSTRLIHKEPRWRRIRTVPIGFKTVWLKTEVPSANCQDCHKNFEVAPLLPRLTSTTRNGSASTSSA